LAEGEAWGEEKSGRHELTEGEYHSGPGGKKNGIRKRKALPMGIGESGSKGKIFLQFRGNGRCDLNAPKRKSMGAFSNQERRKEMHKST